MGAPSKYDEETRRKTIARVIAGETYSEVGRDLGVSGNAVKLWRSKLGDEPGTESKPKRSKAEKPAKRKAAKKRAPKVVEPESVDLDVYAVCDAWSLPYPLAILVHGARKLIEADDFDVLAQVEEAVAKHREQMEAWAA